ncbi:catenin alpha-2 isoform X1, partial [Lates japonicus]
MGAHPYARNHACVKDGDSPDLTALGSTTQPTILQGSPLLAHHHLHLPTLLLWSGRWEGSLFRRAAVGGGGISETPTEACSLRFSTTALRKAETRRCTQFVDLQEVLSPTVKETMTTATSPILLKWDPKSLEIRTLTVERLLEPLVTQVTTLVNTSNKGPSSKKKGRSKKAHVLAVSVEQATQNFLEKGEQIAKDSQDLKEELIAAVEDVRKQGETMRIASSEFADDPCSSVKRGTMVRAARALLSAVTRLLILADMADVMRLLAHLKIVEEALEGVKNATNEQDLANRFKEFGKEMVKLNYVAARRQQELKDPQCRDEMAAARGALKKNATMLYTASQAFLRHPDVAATRANRDYVFKQVQEAIGGISSAAQATSPTDEKHGHAGIGELAAALNEFD